MIESAIIYIMNHELFLDFVLEMNRRLSAVDWIMILKVCAVMLFSMFLVCSLILVNDRLFEGVLNRRMKVHHLTIRNDGNFDSVYLLHTVDLPNTLAVRFRIGGSPMIWVSFDSGEEQPQKQLTAQQQQQPAAAAALSAEQEDTESGKHTVSELVPDLSDPLKPIQAVTQVASDIGKKAGFFASIFSTVSVLLPSMPGSMKNAQSALKDVQQNANSFVGQVNTKTNAVNTLGDQFGKIAGADKVGALAQSSAAKPSEFAKDLLESDAKQSYHAGGAMKEPVDSAEGNLNIGDNFVYDEEVWHRNIGKEDEKGGALNYAQSKVLAPGESLRIDIEILNLSESNAPISQLYKIEVIQVPQSNLHLSSVSRFLNGIVTFEKVSQLSRILPTSLVVVLIVVAVQLIAAFSYFIF